MYRRRRRDDQRIIILAMVVVDQESGVGAANSSTSFKSFESFYLSIMMTHMDFSKCLFGCACESFGVVTSLQGLTLEK